MLESETTEWKRPIEIIIATKKSLIRAEVLDNGEYTQSNAKTDSKIYIGML